MICWRESGEIFATDWTNEPTKRQLTITYAFIQIPCNPKLLVLASTKKPGTEYRPNKTYWLQHNLLSCWHWTEFLSIWLTNYAFALIRYWAALFLEDNKELVVAGANMMLQIALKLLNKKQKPAGRQVLEDKDASRQRDWRRPSLLCFLIGWRSTDDWVRYLCV